MDSDTPLSRAIKKAGSQDALAAQIGVRQSHISYWLTKAVRGVPPEHCGAIERATGIPRHELRPDLWEAPGAEAAA